MIIESLKSDGIQIDEIDGLSQYKSKIPPEIE